MSFENYISEILSFLGGLGVGSFVTLRITRKNRDVAISGSANQRGAQAGGDIVGRDKNTMNRK